MSGRTGQVSVRLSVRRPLPFAVLPTGSPALAAALLALWLTGGIATAQQTRPADGSATVAAADRTSQSPASSRSKGKPWLGEWRSPGKPVAPIAIDYTLSGEPALGEPLTIDLRVRGHRALGNVAVELRPDAGLVVGRRAAAAGLALAEGESLEQTVTVTPLATGAMRLGVLVVADVGGRRQARSVTIPLTVGSPDADRRRAGTLKTDPAGRTVISLPAEEPE